MSHDSEAESYNNLVRLQDDPINAQRFLRWTNEGLVDGASAFRLYEKRIHDILGGVHYAGMFVEHNAPWKDGTSSDVFLSENNAMVQTLQPRFVRGV